MNYFKKRRELKENKILVNYLDHLQNPPISYPEGYLGVHRNKINWIAWLVGYYEGKTGSTPKEMLELLLNPILTPYINPDVSIEDNLKREIESIKFLYHWVYYKQITGF